MLLQKLNPIVYLHFMTQPLKTVGYKGVVEPKEETRQIISALIHCVARNPFGVCMHTNISYAETTGKPLRRTTRKIVQNKLSRKTKNINIKLSNHVLACIRNYLKKIFLISRFQSRPPPR